MASIGFQTIPNKLRKKIRHACKDLVLKFDSGYGITLEDLYTHLLVTGTTGSGKTKSIILPALKKLIELGLAGLVIDIKGTMRKQVRQLCESVGRADDLIELGTDKRATPINLLQGLDANETFTLLQTLTFSSFNNQSHNLDFHIKGVHAANDCVTLLRFLSVWDRRFTPTLTLVTEMVNKYEEAQTLYKLFKEKVYNPANEEHASFVASIEHNNFHILRDFSDAGKDSTREEQRTYAMQGIRIALKAFMDVPGVQTKFGSAQGQALDLKTLLKQGKIIQLRFAPGTGFASTMLSRYLTRAYYSALFSLSLAGSIEKSTFICMDEYQEFADFSDNQFSDISFVAQAREFKSIFMIATQSLSAMFNRGASLPAVQALVSNCNNRISFYSDDPLTQDMVNRLDGRCSLVDLDPGQAFVSQYDQVTRKHKYGLQTFQKAYAGVEKIIAAPESPAPEIIEPVPQAPSLFRLAIKAKQFIPDTDKDKNRRSGFMARRDNSPRRKDRENDEFEFMDDIEKEQQEEKPLCDHWLVREFPEFFDIPSATIDIPHGWDNTVRNAFKAFQATGLQIFISALVMRGTGLKIRPAMKDGVYASEQGALQLLERLLANVSNTCPICGESLSLIQTGVEPYGLDLDSTQNECPICEECMIKFGLATRSAPAPKM